MRATQPLDPVAAREMLECRCGIDQAAIEEDPPLPALGRGAIGERHRDRPPREGLAIDPWQGRTAAGDLFRHDAAAGFLDDVVAAPPKLGEQARLAAAGAAGDGDEAIQEDAITPPAGCGPSWCGAGASRDRPGAAR